jgi:hypothetical protein
MLDRPATWRDQVRQVMTPAEPSFGKEVSMSFFHDATPFVFSDNNRVSKTRCLFGKSVTIEGNTLTWRAVKMLTEDTWKVAGYNCEDEWCLITINFAESCGTICKSQGISDDLLIELNSWEQCPLPREW